MKERELRVYVFKFPGRDAGPSCAAATLSPAWVFYQFRGESVKDYKSL